MDDARGRVVKPDRGSTNTEAALLAALEDETLRPKRRIDLLLELTPVATGLSVPKMERLLDATDLRIRVGALHVLQRIGTPDAVDVMVAVLDRGDSSTVGWASHCLTTDNAPGNDTPALLECLVARGDALSGTGKALLIHAIGRQGNRDAVPAVAALLNDRERTTRRAAARELARLGGDAGRRALEDAVATQSWWRSRYAREALLHIR
jgi:HEAT repeat protein